MCLFLSAVARSSLPDLLAVQPDILAARYPVHELSVSNWIASFNSSHMAIVAVNAFCLRSQTILLGIKSGK